MSLKTQRQGQVGVNVVERVVLRDWQSRWQALDAQNDDGVDGLIFLESNGEATGQVIYVQIKTYSGVRENAVGHLPITIGVAKLRKAISRWRRLVGAAIIIYVDPVSLEAYWADARKIDAGKSQVFVPKSQKFDRTARRGISQLCGTTHRDLLIPTFVAEPAHFAHLASKDYIKVAARKLYRELQSTPVRLGGNGARVTFGRHGWRHITRRDRPKLTRYQSFVLLGLVRPILESTSEADLTFSSSPPYQGKSLFAARTVVSFPFRHTGIVKVVLLVRHAPNGAEYEFHTVYEPRRRRDVLGVREPLSQ